MEAEVCAGFFNAAVASTLHTPKRGTKPLDPVIDAAGNEQYLRMAKDRIFRTDHRQHYMDLYTNALTRNGAGLAATIHCAGFEPQDLSTVDALRDAGYNMRVSNRAAMTIDELEKVRDALKDLYARGSGILGRYRKVCRWIARTRFNGTRTEVKIASAVRDILMDMLKKRKLLQASAHGGVVTQQHALRVDLENLPELGDDCRAILGWLVADPDDHRRSKSVVAQEDQELEDVDSFGSSTSTGEEVQEQKEDDGVGGMASAEEEDDDFPPMFEDEPKEENRCGRLETEIEDTTVEHGGMASAAEEGDGAKKENGDFPPMSEDQPKEEHQCGRQTREIEDAPVIIDDDEQFDPRERGTWNEAVLPANLNRIGDEEPYEYQRKEPYGTSYWLTADDIAHVVGTFVEHHKGMLPRSVTHPTVLAKDMPLRKCGDGFQTDICNTEHPTVPKNDKRFIGNGTHWVGTLWMPKTPPAYGLWIFDPMGNEAHLRYIKETLPLAHICTLQKQQDSWRCGYLSLWFKLVLMLKLSATFKDGSEWPCTSAHEWRQWMGRAPPAAYPMWFGACFFCVRT